MKITVPISPVPASRPRVVKKELKNGKTLNLVYYGKAHTQYVKDSDRLIKQAQITKTTAQKVDIEFYIQIPKSKTKAFKTQNNNKVNIQKPDIDNLIKLILDILTDKGYWTDDNLIVDLKAVKKWSLDNPRTEIIIKDYEE